MATHHEENDETSEKSTGSDDAFPQTDDAFLLTSYLDEVEDRVEKLRRHASALQQERDSLLTVLSQLKQEGETSLPAGECEELLINIDRLKKRCESVDIQVHTYRTSEQKTAFSTIDSLVRDLERQCVLGDPKINGYRERAETFLNACVSDVVPTGLIDYKFQGMILDCKLEDQKKVRHRLECLVDGRCHVNFLEEEANRETLQQSDNNERSIAK